MSDPVKDAWNEVSEGFSRLGGAMKDRYRGDDRPGSADAPAGEREEGLREALDRLIAAGRDVGQRAVDVIKDAEVNAQAKHAAASLNDALSATVDMIGREVGGLFGHREPEPGGATSATVDEATDAAVADLDAGPSDEAPRRP